MLFATHPTRRSGDETKQCTQRPSEPFCRGDRQCPRLDPACGSGNFLGDSMQQLLNLEKEVIAFARDVGLSGFFPSVGPEQVHGIELDRAKAIVASACLRKVMSSLKTRSGTTIPPPYAHPTWSTQTRKM